MAEGLVPRLTVTLLMLSFAAWHWARLERPVLGGVEVVVLCALAVVPGVVWALRRNVPLLVAASLLSVWGAVWAAFGYQPWERNHPFYPVRVYDGIQDGARTWFQTVTPFDPARFPSTGALVEISFFALAAVSAWLLLDGRLAIAAVAAAFALFAIPSTAGSFQSPGLRSALFLVLAVAILAVAQRREPLRGPALGQLAALGTAAVICGLVAGGAPGVAKGAFFDWRNWNPMQGDGPRQSMGFMWDMTYGPLKYPKKKLTVFEVDSPRPLYWKAGVLTEFARDRWVASPIVQAPFPGTDRIGIPELGLPPKATRPDHKGDIIVSTFKIKALADARLLTTGQPLQWNLDRKVDAEVNTDGSVKLGRDPSRNQQYDARSYAPDPTATQLVRAQGPFPGTISSDIVVNGRRVPVWGSIGGVQPAIFDGILDPPLVTASNDAWRRSGARGAGTEYGAVIALEAYFRSDRFTYSVTPQYRGDMPVLAEFMLTSRQGYCQMFAGAMALVLRMHGIPARVAVGFTTGTQSRANHYVVNNRNAHAWVEAYFPGYGWVPFEPTPGRVLQALASTSNKSFGSNFQGGTAQSYLKKLGFNKYLPNGGLALLFRAGGPALGQRGDLNLHKGRGNAGAFTGIPSSSGGNRGSFVAWVFTAAVVLIAALAALKFAAVRWRYLRRGPRGQASAVFHELSTYLGDQGVAVPQNATFEELVGILRTTWGIDASGLATAGSAARYAPPARAARAGRDVRPQMRRVRRELRRNVPRSDRASGALRLRSALSQTTHLD
jgi:transglutaminase-like putative cysteine protease